MVHFRWPSLPVRAVNAESKSEQTAELYKGTWNVSEDEAQRHPPLAFSLEGTRSAGSIQRYSFAVKSVAAHSGYKVKLVRPSRLAAKRRATALLWKRRAAICFKRGIPFSGSCIV